MGSEGIGSLDSQPVYRKMDGGVFVRNDPLG